MILLCLISLRMIVLYISLWILILSSSSNGIYHLLSLVLPCLFCSITNLIYDLYIVMLTAMTFQILINNNNYVMLYITITIISIYIYTLSVTKGAFVTVRSILSSAEPMLSTFTKHLYFNAMNPI